MSLTNAGLGNLARLPPEVRLCIWDWLLPRHIIRTISGPPIFERRQTRLAILRTSKELYAEISHHLYSHISVSIRINPQKKQWLAFRIDKLHISWLIEEKKDATQRGFDEFPFHRVPIHIGIYPPNPASPGDLIRLWYNVQNLVNIIIHTPSIRGLHVQFLNSRKSRWHQGGQGLKSVRYFPWYNAEFYDHQIIYLQFCRLKEVKCMKVSYATDLDGVLRWTIEDGAGVHLFKQVCEHDRQCTCDGPHVRISSESDSVDDFFTGMNRCFRDMLSGDILPGRTARTLHQQVIKEMHRKRIKRLKRKLLGKRIENWLAGTLKGPGMGGHRDEQVLGNIELSKENWQVHGKDSYGAWSQRIPKWPLFSTFLLLITSLALFVVTLPSVRQRTEDIGYHRVHSPLWDVVRYQNVQFHAQFGSTPLFKGSVPPELSKTWEDVERADLILIDGHDMDALGEPKENATKLGNKYFTLIAAFHQFHWIDLVREFVHRGDYREKMAFEELRRTSLGRVGASMQG